MESKINTDRGNFTISRIQEQRMSSFSRKKSSHVLFYERG